jgi:hypothetical protein
MRLFPSWPGHGARHVNSESRLCANIAPAFRRLLEEVHAVVGSGSAPARRPGRASRARGGRRCTRPGRETSASMPGGRAALLDLAARLSAASALKAVAGDGPAAGRQIEGHRPMPRAPPVTIAVESFVLHRRPSRIMMQKGQRITIHRSRALSGGARHGASPKGVRVQRQAGTCPSALDRGQWTVRIIGQHPPRASRLSNSLKLNELYPMTRPPG